MRDAEQDVFSRPIAQQLDRGRTDDAARQVSRLAVEGAGTAEHEVDASIARIERRTDEWKSFLFDLSADVRVDDFQRRVPADVATCEVLQAFGPLVRGEARREIRKLLEKVRPFFRWCDQYRTPSTTHQTLRYAPQQQTRQEAA